MTSTSKKFLILALVLLASIAEAQNYSLEIIQPQAGLTTGANATNRFYKAYPGLDYNVRLGVVGGDYPYTFSLTTCPSGMTINSSTGEITWPGASVTASGQPGTGWQVTASVTDTGASDTQTVTWYVYVTTTGFHFLDAVSGLTVAQGGTGTLANPWHDIADWDLSSRDDTTHANDFLYYRATNETHKYHVNPNNPGYYYQRLNSGYKPVVWIGYPGDTRPVIDMTMGYFQPEVQSANLYMDGIEFAGNNDQSWIFRMTSTGNNVFIRNCYFHDITGNVGDNASFLMFTDPGTNTLDANYWVFQENTFSNLFGDGGSDIDCAYWVNKCLWEDNTCTNINGHGIGTKEGNRYWTIRHNTITMGSLLNSAGLIALVCGVPIQYSGAGASEREGYHEICYNFITTANANQSTVGLNTGSYAAGYPINVYRNTLAGPALQYSTQSTNGPFTWSKNIIFNASSETDNITTSDIDYSTNYVLDDNMDLASGAGIIDSSGHLIGDYTQYVGTYGWETGTAPAPPTLSNVTISGGSFR